MAFTLSQSWDAGAFAPGATRAPLLPPRLADGSRRAGAILLSILVHLLLVVFLLNRIAGPPETGEGRGSGDRAMTMLDLSDSGSPAPASSRPQVRPASVPAPASPVDATFPDQSVPAEWTVSRLPPSPMAIAGLPASGQVAGIGTGAGRAASGVYDPYAGAAPLRPGVDGAGPPQSIAGRVLGFLGFEQDGFALDEAALEAIRSAVARGLPGQAGTAEIVVRVSPTGMVLEADARGGSAAPRVRDALARALRGKRLFHGTASAARVVTLPVLSMG